MKLSEVVAVGRNLRSISSQAGLQLLNVLVTLTLSHRSFNYDTDHGMGLLLDFDLLVALTHWVYFLFSLRELLMLWPPVLV